MKLRNIVHVRNLLVILHLLYKRFQHNASLMVGGEKLSIPLGGAGSLPLLSWRESWKTEIIRRLATIKDGGFVDVGANVGQTLLDFIAACPNQLDRYLGFEPNPVCAAYLEEFRRINRLTGCSVIPVGLSDHTTVLPIYLSSNNPADVGGTIIKDLRSMQREEMKFVPIYRFDYLWEEIGTNTISIIKIDVEGAEMHVLMGMRDSILEFRPYIICEVLHASSPTDLSEYTGRIESLMKLLDEFGYVVFKIVRNAEDDLLGIEPISSFPIKRWDIDSVKECDYLFSPMEDAAKAVTSIN